MSEFLSTFKRADQIAVFALLVSAIAAGVAYTASKRDMEFRRLSTLPKLALSFVDGSDPERTGFVLRNTGLGPARVLNVQVFVRNKFIAEIYDDKQWRLVLDELKRVRPTAQSSTPLQFTSFMSDFYIPAGESVPLFYQKNDALTVSSKQFLQNASDDLAFSACVCSVYDECWQFRSPGLKADPCDSPLAQYFFSGTGPLAEALRGVPRMMEPWQPK